MQKTAAQILLEKLAKREREIVDVVPEEGFVYKFYKPNTAGILIGGELPTSAADKAAEAWAEAGVGEKLTDEEIEKLKAEQTKAEKERELEQQNKRVEVRRERLMEFSYSPKIIIGIPNPAEDEMGFHQIPDNHLEYLFAWITAGGSQAAMLEMFPEKPLPSAGTGNERKLRRSATK
jgi:hypothetical protein